MYPLPPSRGWKKRVAGLGLTSPCGFSTLLGWAPRAQQSQDDPPAQKAVTFLGRQQQKLPSLLRTWAQNWPSITSVTIYWLKPVTGQPRVKGPEHKGHESWEVWVTGGQPAST